MATDPLLELRGIGKRYPGVIANDGVDLTIFPGQIHAVLGENGAGKTTLMKMIYGTIQPDAGSLVWRGQAIRINSPRHARMLGIGMVFQHFSLFETLTVVENARLAVAGSRAVLSEQIRSAGRQFGLPVEPDALVHGLSVGERQRVEIIRCLLQKPALLIMDEPTSVLPPQGVTQLFETLRKLAAAGTSIIYISHKLDEIRTLCDSATILRNGKVTGRTDPRTESTASLARMMIGRELPLTSAAARSRVADAPLLRVSNLNRQPDDPFGVSLKGISLTVGHGEIVGIAGISGNGQSELVELLSGEDHSPERPDSITLEQTPIGNLGANARRRMGLAFIPEDRLGRGAIGTLDLSDNSLLTAHSQGLTKFGWLRRESIRDFAKACIERADVRCRGPQATARSLSGGNLQKFIVGRELALNPRLLLVAQPTWGVDIGAAAAIHQRLIDLRQAGVGILIISEELEELFQLSDRLHVIHGGRLSASVAPQDTSVEQIGEWMTGLFPRATLT